MNKSQRVELQKIIDQLDELKGQIDTFKEDEEGKYENLPEGLQEAESGQKLQTIAEHLSEAVDNLDSSMENLINAINE